MDYKALVRWVGQYRAGGAAALHDARHSSEGTSRAKGRERTVPPMQRLVIVLDCLENEKNYGAMAQKYAVAYHQVYRWVQRYLRDEWRGMNDKRGPADTPPRRNVGRPKPTPKPGSKTAPASQTPARDAAPRRVQLGGDSGDFV